VRSSNHGSDWRSSVSAMAQSSGDMTFRAESNRIDPTGLRIQARSQFRSDITRLTLLSRLSRAFRTIQMATSPRTRPRSTLPSTTPTSAPSGTLTTDLVELEPPATDSDDDEDEDEDEGDEERE
jgi:hypothetical protein